MNISNVPAKLRELREQSGLSQSEAAKKAGVGTKSLSSWETGSRCTSIKVEQLASLCRVYGVTMAEFFGNEPDSFTTTPQESAFFDLLSDVFSLPEEKQAQLLTAYRAMLPVAVEVRRIPMDPLKAAA